MQISCCQFDIQWENKPANFARVRELVSKALAAKTLPPGGILLLPEMFATGFSMNAQRIAEPATGETTAFVRELAALTQSLIIAGITSLNSAGKGLNRALAVAPDGAILADYSKMHPFAPGDEAAHYAPGNQVTTVDWAGTKIGLAVCYDLRFPELFRSQVRQGAEVMVVIANWPAARIAHWRSLLIARAIENQCLVAGCNRTGADPKLQYPGNSIIVDHGGQILAEAGAAEEIITAAHNAPNLREYRAKLPFLKDLRSDFFAG